MENHHNNSASSAMDEFLSGKNNEFVNIYMSSTPAERASIIEYMRRNFNNIDCLNRLISLFNNKDYSTCIPFSEIIVDAHGASVICLKIKYVSMLSLDTLRYFRASIEAMENLLSIDPNDRDTLWNLGQYGYWGGPDLQKSASRSIKCYEKLIELNDPRAGELHLRIGESYSELLEYAKAKEHYISAKQADPSLAVRVDHLIMDIETLQSNLKNQEKKPIISRYPNQHHFKQPLKDFIYADASNLFKDMKFIEKPTKFFTIGSCFAQNICHYLLRRGYTADTIPYSEHINSTHANRVLIDWLLGGDNSTDPNFKKIEKYIVNEANRSREELLNGLRTCDVFIYSLGVAAGFFRQDDGSFVMPGQAELNQRALTSTFRFRTTTVEENVANLRYILSRLYEINPGMKVVLTVSPVPIRVSFQHQSALVTDCISKSTLRVACNEVVQKSGDRCIYWPSFEYVRWLSGHTTPAFGVDDDNATHVSIEFIDSILHTFLRVFSFDSNY